jgi:Flp pilus assembly protein TadG
MRLERLCPIKLRRLLGDTEGASAVEFAVSVPLFFTLFFGLIQVGLMLWSQLGLQHGVEMAARCASLGDIAIKAGINPATNPTACYSANGNAAANASTIKSYAAANSFGLAPPTSVFSVNPGNPPCPGGNLVTAAYPFTTITYLYSITLTASSCYPKV